MLFREILIFAVVLFLFNSAIAYAKTVDIFKTKTVSIELNADVVSRADTVSDDKIDVMGVRESQAVEPLAHIVDKIFILESSGGKFVNCPVGKYNGFGYGQNKYVWSCFDTQEEVRELVEKWFENKLKEHTLEESLCLYNKGIATEECDYVQKFNSI